MKTQTFKSILIQFFFFAALILASCDDSDKPSSNPSAKEDAARVLALQDEFNFLQTFVDESLMDLSYEGGRKSYSKNIVHRLKEVTPCAEAVEEEQPDGSIKVTMNFGEGCKTEDGIILSGKAVLLIAFEETDFHFTITFIDYQETHPDESTSGVANGTSGGTISINIENFVFTQFLDQELTISYEDHSTAEFMSSQKLESDETGLKVTKLDASGKFANGDTFSMTLSSPLIFDFNCNDGAFPVKGIEILTLNGQRTVIDYGDGSCDDDYTAK
jgi:hypothetical protein